MRTLLLATAATLALTAGARSQAVATGDDEGRASNPVAQGIGDRTATDEGTPPEAVIIVPEADRPPQGEALRQADVPDAEPLREVDITDPDAPPIEDAENVIPERRSGEGVQVPTLKAETGLSSPSHTAPVTPDPTRALAEHPPSAPEGFAVADMSTMDPAELLGVRVYSMDGERIGEMDRWLGEAPGQLPEQAVIDVGGLLGLGEKQVAIDTGQLVLMTDTEGNDMRVYVDLTADQIEDMS